jgi:hypothetical protein
VVCNRERPPPLYPAERVNAHDGCRECSRVTIDKGEKREVSDFLVVVVVVVWFSPPQLSYSNTNNIVYMCNHHHRPINGLFPRPADDDIPSSYLVYFFFLSVLFDF